MAISDLPGYIQGYKFDDTDSTCWNAAGEYFIDRAGYSSNPGSRAVVEVGTAAFVAVNSARGVEFDNSWHIYFSCPVAHTGSIIAVFGAPGYTVGATQNIMLLKGDGAAVSYSASPRIQLGYFSGQYNRTILLASAASSVSSNPGTAAIFAHCFSLVPDIGTKRVEVMNSAGTIVNGGTIADDNRGYPMIGGTAGYDVPGTQTWRQILGNLDGVPSSVAPIANSNTLTLCELHFFTGNLNAGDTTAVETELLALEAIYG